MHTYLDFEKSIAELEGKIQELKALATQGAQQGSSVSMQDEIGRLEQKVGQQLKDTYASLTPWQKVQVARHPGRPHFVDYVAKLIEDFTPLSGDRAFADDPAILGGLGRFRGRSVMVIGHEKGWDTQSRIAHNFGLAKPDGYRKAVRLMSLAERFNIPVITLVDTAGAYPGREGEERAQAEAIARSTDRCLSLGVPLIAVIIGEGGSGGAVGLAAGSRVLMLEHSIYGVISPEGAASILWRDSAKSQEAATAMKITAQSLYGFGVIDRIIPEPVGGAHREPDQIIKVTGDAIEEELRGFEKLDAATVRKLRREKFLAMGRVGVF